MTQESGGQRAASNNDGAISYAPATPTRAKLTRAGPISVTVVPTTPGNDAPRPFDDEADPAPGPVILLASTCAWPSVPKLAIALAGANAVVAALAPGHHPLNQTQAVRRHFRYHAARPLRSLHGAIEAARPDLIIACDERAVEHLHRLHRRTSDEAVRRLIERSLGRPATDREAADGEAADGKDLYARIASRDFVIALAGEHGSPAPETQPLTRVSDLRAWARTQPLPWVLKVDGSWGGMGVRIVSSIAEAERAFRDLSRPLRPGFALRRLLLSRDAFWLTPWLHHPSRAVTVQRHIVGRPANCAIAAWNGEILGGIAVAVVSSDGETGPASVVQVTPDPRMLETGARIVQTLGLSGLVGFDFVIEAATGIPFLLEMNPRATPICHLRLGAGRDLVGALIARMQDRPAPEHPAETLCDTIALFPEAGLQLAGHPILAVAYHDTPSGDPGLVDVLLRRRGGKRVSATFTPGPAGAA